MSFFDSDGHRAVFLAAEIKELPQVQQRQDIAIHHEERLIQLFFQELQGTGGTQRLLLEACRHLYAVPRAVAQELGDVIRFVIRGNVDIVKAGFLEPLDLDFKNRLLAEGQKGFGNDFRQRSEAQAQTACQDDCFHWWLSTLLSAARRLFEQILDLWEVPNSCQKSPTVPE